MMSAICAVKLMDRKIVKDLMRMLRLHEAVDELSKANSICLNGHVLNFLRMK